MGAFGEDLDSTVALDTAQEIMATINGMIDRYAGHAEDTGGSFNSLPEIRDVKIPQQLDDDISFGRAVDALDDILARLPTLPPLPVIDEAVPDSPTLSEIPDLSDIEIQDFTDQAPAINIGEAPTMDEFISPDSPVIESVVAPDRPTITLPTAPELTNVDLPAPYTISMPVFDATLADNELLAPTNTFAFNEQEYSSALKTAMASGLLDEVVNGGYGIEPADEAALWNRARERELTGADLATEEATRVFSLSGFPMPTGAMLKAVQRAQAAAMEKISSVNRDIAIKRSDLYLEGKKLAFASALQLENMLVTLHNATMERALNAAKAQIQVSIDIFNAEVAKFNADLEKYKVQATVYEARVRGEIAKVENYRAQVEGARAAVDVQRARVDIYNAQVQGVRALIDVYTADIQAANLLAGLEKMKMDIYRAEVDAFVATIQAKRAEFDAFQAKVNGEIAKVTAYEATARAYLAKVEGKKGLVEVNRLRLQSAIEKNKGLIDAYAMETAFYKDKRDVQKTVHAAAVDLYRAQIQEFDTETQALIRAYSLDQEARSMEYREMIATLSQNTETAKLHLQRVIAIAQLQAEAMKAQAQVYAALGAAALSAINVNTSLSHHYGASESDSRSDATSTSTNTSRDPDIHKSFSDSYSDSTSLNENHNYNSTE